MIRVSKSEGIILRQANFQEADRLLTIYTKHFGRKRLVARGVRRIVSRKKGSLELFNRVLLVFAKGRNVDLITEAAVIDSYPTWRKNLIRVGVAYYFCELVDKLTAEEEENSGIYELLKEALSSLAQAPLKRLIIEFEEKILTLSGFGIPDQYRSSQGSLKPYIENLIEKEIYSPRVIKKLQG